MQTAEDIVRSKGDEIIGIDAEATIREALSLMVGRRVGAVVVTEGDRLVGIWTERDLMRQSLDPGFDPGTARLRQYMVTGLKTAAYHETVFELMDKFLGLRLRHLLVEKDGAYIGLLSIGDVTKACLQEKTSELQELHAIVSWQYYEEWKR